MFLFITLYRLTVKKDFTRNKTYNTVTDKINVNRYIDTNKTVENAIVIDHPTQTLDKIIQNYTQYNKSKNYIVDGKGNIRNMFVSVTDDLLSPKKKVRFSVVDDYNDFSISPSPIRTRKKSSMYDSPKIKSRSSLRIDFENLEKVDKNDKKSNNIFNIVNNPPIYKNFNKNNIGTFISSNIAYEKNTVDTNKFSDIDGILEISENLTENFNVEDNSILEISSEMAINQKDFSDFDIGKSKTFDLEKQNEIDKLK